MKQFPFENVDIFNGAFNYILSRNGGIMCNTNGEVAKGNLESMLTSPESGAVFLEISSNEFIYVEFTSKKYKIFPFSYQLAFQEAGTPPESWELYGKNSTNSEWIKIDTQVDQEVCPSEENHTSCAERTNQIYHITNPIGPFISFKFLQTKTAGSGNMYFRLGGFELYGFVLSLNERFLKITCCKRTALITNTFFIISISIFLGS